MPLNPRNLETLKQTKAVLGKANNLIPKGKTYVQWRDHTYYQWRIVHQDNNTGIKGFHDMQAAFAYEYYQEITGYRTPVIVGEQQAPQFIDTQARLILSQMLGHHKIDVIASHIGSSK